MIKSSPALKSIIIIPARGGSKRLPGKNLMMLGGKPLIAHSIEYALIHKKLADDIVVTSDSDTILDLAKAYDVTGIKRPKELAGDTATTASALKHVLNTLGGPWDNVILLQPTNPLRPTDLLPKCLKIYEAYEKDCLFTVSTLDKKFGKLAQNTFVPENYDFGQRSQDIQPLYYENGLLYITSSQVINSGKVVSKSNYAYLMDHVYATIDIDTSADLQYAEFIYQSSKAK